MAKKDKREKTIVTTSIISILANIVLAGFKAAIGLFSNSIAIISDAINNLSDALSSIITIVGTKLAGKPADKKHPYGYGRIEHITSLIVSVIVLYAGITALTESVEKIINPETPDYNVVTLIILIASIAVKLGLGLFVKARGKKVKSDALSASGADALNDAILTASVLASTVIYMIWGVSLEAYVGVLVSVMIIKAGVELVRESVDSIIGTRIESDLAKQIKAEIVKEPKVRGAFDLILNDYGPNRYLGSVHIEVLDTMTASELDKLSRQIAANIYKKFGVTLHTVGIYSVNTNNDAAMEIEKEIRKIVTSQEGVLQMHGFYINEPEKTISFDVVMDFKVKDRRELCEKIISEVKHNFDEYKINIALDVDSSD